MTRSIPSLAVLLVLAAQLAPAWSQSGPAVEASAPVAVSAQEPGLDTAAAARRKAEHDRIRRERVAIGAQRTADEAQCYQRFAVEDCLKVVRARSREAESRLRAQEIELNDAERTEKAAARRRSIEEKQRSVPAAASPATDEPTAAVVRKPGQDPQAQKILRKQEAQLRARQQRNRAQAQAEEQAGRSAENAQRAAEARARQAQAIESAQQRRARVEKAQAEAAAKGRQPAAPLPAPSPAP